MSEERRNVGELQDVLPAALVTFERWAKFTPIQKAEIVAMLQAWVNIELARDQRATQALLQRPAIRDE